MKNAARRYFDGWAKRYDADMASYHYQEPLAIFKAVQPYIAGRSALKILDIGIGTGLSALPFKPYGHITGLDASGVMLAQCRHKNIADLLIQYDITQSALPFQDAQFDLVLAVGVFEYIKDPAPVFHEIARILKPAGIAALSFEPLETKRLYKKGILSGVVKDTGHQITIQRIKRRGILPMAYRKYLYSLNGVQSQMASSGLFIEACTEDEVYRWSDTQIIPHIQLIIRKEQY